MRPNPTRGSVSRSIRLALRTALAGLLIPAIALAAGNGKLQIHHVDVGQGDGILLISPLGQTALFDDGNYLNCAGIKSYLQGLGLTVVDYHFTSHYHSDHIGCIDDLAAIGITIGTKGYDRGYSYSSGVYTAYVNTLGAKRATIAKNQVVTLDAGAANPVYLKCVDLNGAGVYSPSGSDENAKSLVMKVSYGQFDEVIGGDLTGDTGKDVESVVGPECGDVEIFKVHHHGSMYSNNDAWLNAVTPEVGIIQVGDGNSYGHPTSAALSRLHTHGVKTYWTETGAGVAPNPSWDKVGGTIVVQANPGSGASYTVAGTGFTDTYYNGGGTPPINTTQVASAMTMLKGSISTGDVTRLAVDDAVRVSVSAGVESGAYVTDWYGSVTLAHPPLNLTVTYDGNYTVSRTQYLYLWNWSTGAWVQVDNATVSTTDVTRTWSTSSPAAYVSATREVRLRVRGSTRTAGSYTSRGDYMAFTYDYTAGTLRTPGLDGMIAADVPAGADAVTAAMVAMPEIAPAEAPELPLSVLRSAEATPAEEGITLTWSVDARGHADGFNVYREDANGTRQFVGNEAIVENQGEETVFRFVDPARAGSSGTYWLGARACSGPEALIGPFRVAGAASSAFLRMSIAPNPSRDVTRFAFEAPRAADVRLEIFDVTGRRIATPYQGRVAAGPFEVAWRPGSAGGHALSGVYFARLEGLGRTRITTFTIVP